ncbi:sorting nexin-11 [Kryptolebias marmoratus]|uniref:sorting nexin-11 n=1 Tax=Kryptolebias marmoratus TaxID=37003 RepID=UPI0007F8761A|nr:sorting nexin-11 [Kryptolebias marmoratus]
MSRNHVDDEFVAVRVQDPRLQNEGSWVSYIDYKIFLHTNSKAFTAKTSCVRRRYSEFVWLKKKLQKNAGLVPVPDLPGKSIFYFSNEDFLERRRKGLQVFLNRVVNMTVCLSDSQLHLFLQTQLPVSHIQDCVQGLTPFTVTDAILTYASSNRGLAQAQEEESTREHSLTVSYESTDSPVPHQPNVTLNSNAPPPEESNPLEAVLDSKKPSVRISQKNNHLEVVVEDREPTQASFYLGENPSDSGSLSSGEQSDRRSCQIQTPVEVHSLCGADTGVPTNTEEETADPSESEENGNREEVLPVRVNDSEEDVVESDAAPEDVSSEEPASENHKKSQVYEGQSAKVRPEREKSDGSGSKDEIQEETQNVNGGPEVEPRDSLQEKQQEIEHTDNEEILQSDLHVERQNMNGAPEVEPDDSVPEKHKQEVEHTDKDEILLGTVNVNGAPEVEPDDFIQEKLKQEVEHKDEEETPLQPELHQNSLNGNGAPELEPNCLVQEKHKQEVENPNMNGAPEVEPDDSIPEILPQEVDHMSKDEILLETVNVNGAPEVEPDDSVEEHTDGDESNEDSRSLTSSNESIIRCSEDTEDVRLWTEEEELHMNGSLGGTEDEAQQHMTNIRDLSESSDVTENCDFSILETSCLTGDGGKFRKQDAPSSPLLNGSETH